MLAENVTSVLDLFKTRPPSLIGVDIASTSLKLVELADAGKGLYRLERYVIEPLPKDTVTDGNVLNIELASDVLKRAWKRLEITERRHTAHHLVEHDSQRVDVTTRSRWLAPQHLGRDVMWGTHCHSSCG